MSDTPSQSSDRPSAIQLLQDFLTANNIQIVTMPLTVRDIKDGGLVIDAPRFTARFTSTPVEENGESKK